MCELVELQHSLVASDAGSHERIVVGCGDRDDIDFVGLILRVFLSLGGGEFLILEAGGNHRDGVAAGNEGRR